MTTRKHSNTNNKSSLIELQTNKTDDGEKEKKSQKSKEAKQDIDIDDGVTNNNTPLLRDEKDEVVTDGPSHKKKYSVLSNSSYVVVKDISEDNDENNASTTKKVEAASQVATTYEQVKYYISLFLGTLCIVCIFAFLFLVPFVLDPAISTIKHHMSDEPVTCRVSSVEVQHGKSNCDWSSCREGCTADIFECHQVRIQYTHILWSHVVDDGSGKNRRKQKSSQFDGSVWMDLERFDLKENKMMSDTPLLINIKGCGYPPEVNCTSFIQHYQTLMYEDETFPCYYSQVNPWIVLEEYNFQSTVISVILSILVPNGIFIVSILVLLYWHCPYVGEKKKKQKELNL